MSWSFRGPHLRLCQPATIMSLCGLSRSSRCFAGVVSAGLRPAAGAAWNRTSRSARRPRSVACRAGGRGHGCNGCGFAGGHPAEFGHLGDEAAHSRSNSGEWDAAAGPVTRLFSRATALSIRARSLRSDDPAWFLGADQVFEIVGDSLSLTAQIRALSRLRMSTNWARRVRSLPCGNRRPAYGRNCMKPAPSPVSSSPASRPCLGSGRLRSVRVARHPQASGSALRAELAVAAPFLAKVAPLTAGSNRLPGAAIMPAYPGTDAGE